MLQKIMNQIIKKGYELSLVVIGDSIKMSIFSEKGMGDAIIQATLDDCIKVFCEQYPGVVNPDDYLLFMTKDQTVPEEIIEMSIDHPFFSEFKRILNNSLQNAIHFTDQNTTATISTKIEVNEKYNAPEFANDAKLISPVEFSIGLATKRDFSKIKGCSKEFVARMVDGHMLLVDPDRQMSLDEIEKQQDEPAGEVEPDTAAPEEEIADFGQLFEPPMEDPDEQDPDEE